MPLPPTNCAIPTDTCCRSIYDMAEFLLNAVHPAVAECIGEGPACPPSFVKYVTFGVGDDGIADGLSIACGGVGPSPVTGSGNSGVQMPLGLFRCDFIFRLRESGWPMAYVVNDGLSLPDPLIQHQLALHAYAHGERMYRKLLSMLRSLETGSLQFPGNPGPVKGLLSPLLPLTPSGGSIGWTTILTLDLPWNAGF